MTLAESDANGDNAAASSGSQLDRLLALAAEREPVRTAVVHPCGAVSLSGALEAARMRLIEPVLIGPAEEIKAAAAAAGEDPTCLPLVPVDTVQAPAAEPCSSPL